MTQHQLERAVARSTGESLTLVRRLGFGPSTPTTLEPEDLALAVDCPFCGQPCGLTCDASGLPAMAECDPCDLYFDFKTDEVYAASAGATIAA